MQWALDTHNLSPPFPITWKWAVSRVVFWLPLVENRGSRNSSEQSCDCLLFAVLSCEQNKAMWLANLLINYWYWVWDLYLSTQLYNWSNMRIIRQLWMLVSTGAGRVFDRCHKQVIGHVFARYSGLYKWIQSRVELYSQLNVSTL